MDWNRWEADYGTLPAEWLSCGALTNPAELLRGEEVYRLLRLCEAAEGEASSDWELFSAFCRVYPMLKGHPMHAAIARLLQVHFSVCDEICEENSERIWRAAVADLAMHPRDAIDFLPTGELSLLCETSAPPAALPQRCKPVLLGNLLLEQPPQSLAAWRESIVKVLSAYVGAGCNRLVLRLDREFSFVPPDIYHAEQALQSRRRGDGERRMLTAQLLREICAYGTRHQLSVLVEAECDSAQTAALLRYTEDAVGLLPMWVTVQDVRAMLPLLDFMALPHRNFIKPALQAKHYPSHGELRTAVLSLAARYPSARICTVTGSDLRLVTHLRASTETAFCELL